MYSVPEPSTLRGMRPANAFEPFSEALLERTLQHCFELQVARDPDRPAIWTDDGELSYAALDRHANRVAAEILDRLGPDPSAVVLCFHQGPASVAAILGALKARKFYVPLDPRSPLEECARVLDECDARLVLGDRSSAPRARALAQTRHAALVEIDVGARVTDGPRIDLAGAADDLAYVFYTSGSSGRPKGVCDTHRNVLHNVLRYTNSLHFCRDDRLTMIQACSFSGTVSTLFGALLNGACLLPFDFPGASPGKLADWMARSRPTVYHSVPAIFRSFLATGPRAFPSVRLIRLEGDQTSPRDLVLYRRHFSPDCILVNGLGTTETGLAAQYFVSAEDSERTQVVPVGHATHGVALRVLDAQGQPCAAGEVGEIGVVSRYLALGYWRQPELTSERFRADSSEEGGARLYRTGDLGRFRTDGCLEHLGRLDARVKVHGQWVELAEVEAHLHTLDGVKEALVAWHTDLPSARLVAYLVPSADPAPSRAALRRELEKRLPLFKIPSRFVWLDASPVTSAGKLDRGALPPPDVTAFSREILPPRNLVELRLTQLWERILELEPIGALDDFFELGGDSLHALLLVDAIAEEFGRQISASSLLETRTVETLAEMLRGGAAAPPFVVLQGGSKDTTPFHFFHGDYLGGGLYCRALAQRLGKEQPFCVLTPCGVDGRSLPPSYEAMARRHLDVLRRARPRGPYRLGGSCNGGLVAFEVARLLEAEGERVERLVLVSASAANVRFTRLRGAIESLGGLVGARSAVRRALYRRLRELSLRLGEGPARERLGQALRRATKLPGALAALLGGESKTPGSVHGASARDYLRQRYQEIDAEYVPRRYGGPVHLIWPETDPEPVERAAQYWGKLSPSVVLRRVPGNHTTCLTKHVDALAEQIRACLG